MEENSTKRSRKTKLVPRQYLDSDDENIAQMQDEIEEAIASINPQTILRKLVPNEDPTSSLEFSVKVEVEEFNEEEEPVIQQVGETEIHQEEEPEIQQVGETEIHQEEEPEIQQEDEPETQREEDYRVEVHTIDNSQSIEVVEEVDIPLEKAPKKPGVKKKNLPLEPYKIDEDILRAEIDSITTETSNKADKLIQIYTRNYYGRFHKFTPDSVFNIKVQERLKKWRIWYDALPDERDSPSMYICYICDIAWWHLSEFRDHIKYHQDIRFGHESSKNDFKITIFQGSATEYRRIPIASDCWKCGKNFSAHESYKCQGCLMCFNSCTLLSLHEGECDFYMNLFRDVNDTSKLYKCFICPYKHWMCNELQRHMLYCHSVRSDVPMYWMSKTCPRCSVDYNDYNFHECLERPIVDACSDCFKTFHTKESLQLHYKNSKLNASCRICNKVLKRGCTEMQHLLKHTDKYILMYKCNLCTEPLFFHDSKAIRRHKLILHRKRKDYSEKVFIPKRLLDRFTPIPTNISNSKPIQKIIEKPEVSFNRNVTSDMVQNSITDYFDAELGVRVTVIDKNTIKEMLKTASEREELVNANPAELKSFLAENMIIKTENDSETESNTFETNEHEDSTIEINTDVQIKQEIDDEFEINDDFETNDEFETFDDDESEFGNAKIKQEAMDIEEYIIQNAEINGMDIGYMNVKTENEENEPTQKIGSVELEIKNETPSETDECDVNVDDNPMVIVSECEDNSSDKFDETTKPKGGTKPKVQRNKKGTYKTIKFISNYKCTKCDTTSPSLYKYLQHFKKYKYKVPTCPKCFKQFKCTLELTSHVYTHIKNNYAVIHSINYKKKEERKKLKTNLNYQCRMCKANLCSSKFFEHWESHLKILDDEASEEIKYTYQKPQFKLMLDILQGIDSPEARASCGKKCVKCNKKFQRSSDCKRHYIEHLLGDAYKERDKNGCLMCQICGRGFDERENYKSHLRGHASLPIYKCTICNKTFGDSSNFCKHKKVHAPVFICDICNKKFNARVCFIKHIKMHEVTKPIRCDTCQKLFYSQSSYKKHLKKNRARFRCPICDIYFTALKDKWDHMWKVHKERKYIADCPLCKKSFRKYMDVVQHLKKDHKGSKYDYKRGKGRNYKKRFNLDLEDDSSNNTADERARENN